MIPCKDAVERLWSYLDRELDERFTKEVEEHLGVCRHCCGELEFARQVRGRLAASGERAAMPEETRARLEGFLKGIGA